MCFFPRNGATLNDSLYFFYIPRYFISTKWKLIQKETGNCGERFFIKVEIIVIILFPQNGKAFNGLYYFKRVENTRGRNLKMCLFPRSYFLYFYIYFNFQEVGNTSPMCYFHEEEKNSMICITSKKFKF